MAPEWRLSLQLKWQELWQCGQQPYEEEGARQEAKAACQALDKLFELPYLDLLDESDELLHHRWCRWGGQGSGHKGRGWGGCLTCLLWACCKVEVGCCITSRGDGG